MAQKMKKKNRMKQKPNTFFGSAHVRDRQSAAYSFPQTSRHAASVLLPSVLMQVVVSLLGESAVIEFSLKKCNCMEIALDNAHT